MRRVITSFAALLLLFVVLCMPAIAGKDDDEAVKKGEKAPASWNFPTPKPLRILAVHGRWYPTYALERAYARLGGAYLTDTWQHPQALRFYPGEYEDLMGHHLVVIANCNSGSFSAVNRVRIKNYVAAGGSVLFLGGKYTFGGDFHGTVFEEIAPVTFAEKKDIVFTPAGFTLAPGPQQVGVGMAKLDWKAEPRVYWHHEVTPKAGSKVLLTAGGKPLLIVGAYGKGRVAVFAGSVMGIPQDKQLPFWSWNGWPSVMAGTINWLTEGFTQANTLMDELTRARMSADLIGKSRVSLPELAPKILRYAQLCTDKAAAKVLVKAIIDNDGELTVEQADALSDRVRPFVDGEFTGLADQLLQAGHSGKAMLGLQILGQTKSPKARAVLLSALKVGDVERDDDDGFDGGLVEKVPEDQSQRNFAIRLGALAGLSSLGDTTALPEIRVWLRRYDKLRSDPSKFPIDVTQNDMLYQEAVLAALRCGDQEAAGPAIDSLLENTYIFIRMTLVMDAPNYGEDLTLIHNKERVAKYLAQTRLRNLRQYKKLAGLPPAVLPALARRLAAEDDIRVAQLAYAAFGKAFNPNGKLSTEVSGLLKASPIPAVGDLATNE
ncbi:MAG: glutamine amidotransferase [Armatimonadota bacterium]